ncbi:MAG TPA: glycosyltransferase [Pyrinomonadaceae bacterium]|nr:glycosyltransferase [Pyrinomonadaceae bacterium]
MNSDAKKSLSVVVIGRNEGLRLARCIESIQAMRFNGKVEIIYVDSNSTDGSASRAKWLGAKVISVRPDRPSAALGRNAGWREATAPFVLFLDGDTILAPDFVQTAMKSFADPRVAVVCGNRRETNTKGSFYNRALDLDWISPAGAADYCGGDALMRRPVLEKVSGYDERLIAGEEPEMCARMRAQGFSIQHIDEPMTGHDLAITHFSQYWKRAFRTGHAYAEVSQHLRGSATPLWEREAKANLVRSTFLLSFLVLSIIAAAFFYSFIPLILAAAFFSALVIRTASKVGWKSTDWVTRLLYGVHSHFQQVPILFGQLSYRRDQSKGVQRQLIEYKGASS